MSKEVWGLVGKGSQGSVVCAEVVSYQLHQLTPADPQRMVSWPGPHWEGCSRSWDFASSFSCFFSPGLVKFARYRMA